MVLLLVGVRLSNPWEWSFCILVSARVCPCASYISTPTLEPESLYTTFLVTVVTYVTRYLGNTTVQEVFVSFVAMVTVLISCNHYLNVNSQPCTKTIVGICRSAHENMTAVANDILRASCSVI